MFTEISEAEIELSGDIKEIVDFTRVSYSIEDQSNIHILCRDAEGKQTVHQLNIDDSVQMEIGAD